MTNRRRISFLLATDHFNNIPENYLIIEDSRNGVLAAKTYGIKCLSYINEGSGNQDLSTTDLIVDSLSIALIPK